MKKIYGLFFMTICCLVVNMVSAAEIDSIEKFIKDVEWEKLETKLDVNGIEQQFESPFFKQFKAKLLNNEIVPVGGAVDNGNFEYEISTKGEKSKITLSANDETSFSFLMDCWIIRANRMAKEKRHHDFVNSLKELIAFVHIFSATDKESFIYVLDIRRVTGLQTRIAKILLENAGLLSDDDLKYFRADRFLTAKRETSKILRVKTPVEIQSDSTDILMTSFALISYFHKNGSYPEEIGQLSPDYLKIIPETISYKRNMNGFTLKGKYSFPLNISL